MKHAVMQQPQQPPRPQQELLESGAHDGSAGAASMASTSMASTSMANTSMASSANSALNPAEMSQLLEAFNTAASRLQGTHEALTSEVIRLRRELHEANEAVERSRRLAALGEMAAGIAHEVRNPLGSIRLYAKMLEDDLESHPQQRTLACKITSATRAVEAIVGDVLSFAREIKVRHELVSAKHVLDSALEHMTSASVPGAALTRIVRNPQQEERVLLSCDSALLAAALANIVRNAMEAMEEHNAPQRELVIEVRAAKLSFASGRRVRACVLSVIDSGPGVPPEVVQRMFNPFFTTRQHGTGLGLAIVHRIVDAHGGRVSVRNNAELHAGVPGACISIVLPGQPEDAEVVVLRSEGGANASTMQELHATAKAPKPRKPMRRSPSA